MFFPIRGILHELSKSNQTLLRTKQLHALIITTHLSEDPFYGTRLIQLYGANGNLASARNVFDQTPKRSVYLWNSIIRAHARAHEFDTTFSMFSSMLRSETRHDSFTYACMLRTCSDCADIVRLRAVHGGIIVSGLGAESVSGSALVRAYSKLGVVDKADSVFSGMTSPDLVLCNAMVSGYGHCGLWGKGLKLFSEMRCRGIKPDGYTLVGLISGLADSSLLGIGQGLHCYCLKINLDSDFHTSSVLVSMYSKCSCLSSAERVFGRLSQPDLVTWSALITGYSQCGEFREALCFFRKMNLEGNRADSVLIASVLAASAQSVGIGPGREIHGYILRNGYMVEVMVVSALIDMYMKCGFVDLSIQVFRTMPNKSTVSYNSVISGLGLHGLAFEAFKMFEEMLENEIKPDGATFSALLCSCCHAGLLDVGREIFTRMQSKFGVQVKTEHCVHLVRLLGMNGELEEAYNLILTLPEPIDSGIWGAFLSGCDFHGDSDMAEVAARHVFEIEPRKTAYKVMLSNIYAGNARWDDVKNLREAIEKEGMWKMTALSSWRQ